MTPSQRRRLRLWTPAFVVGVLVSVLVFQHHTDAALPIFWTACIFGLLAVTDRKDTAYGTP